jgi:hypothetical protein
MLEGPRGDSGETRPERRAHRREYQSQPNRIVRIDTIEQHQQYGYYFFALTSTVSFRRLPQYSALFH